MGLTKQRKVIESVLQEAGRPLTRDEILSIGRIHLPRLGSATVDRTIRDMAAQFTIVGLDFPGQSRCYELPAESEHPHFICRHCDRVFDLPIAMQLPQVTAPKGFLITGGEIIYSGTCSDCRAK